MQCISLLVTLGPLSGKIFAGTGSSEDLFHFVGLPHLLINNEEDFRAFEDVVVGLVAEGTAVLEPAPGSAAAQNLLLLLLESFL
jgi:hypothetical protein